MTRLNTYLLPNRGKLILEEILVESPMKHLEHFEDLIIDKGVSGLNQNIRTIKTILSSLNGESTGGMAIRTKWDGSPDFIVGLDKDDKFFISTKSAFNKVPKLAYTDRDIDTMFTGDELKEKLKYGLKYLPEVITKGIFQVSLMFIDKDIKVRNIDGLKHMTFTPNTLTYAVPDDDSDLAKEIRRAKIGIVAHATYKDVDLSNAMLNAKKEMFGNSPNVWIQDSSLKDVSGVVNFDQREQSDIEIRLLELEDMSDKISKGFFVEMDNIGLKALYKIWINSLVRSGTVLMSPKVGIELFTKFVEDRLQKEISSVKTGKSKEAKQSVLDTMVSFIQRRAKQFGYLFNITKILTDLKQVILKKLNSIKTLGTFMQRGDHFETAAPEGFVVVDNDGSVLKLVSRMEFSRENLNNPKFR